MRKANHGVTLIELIVVLVVIGILAAIAVPSYRDYVMRANRTEGRAALLALATAQEKFYLQCNTYTNALNPKVSTACDPANLKFDPASERGYYTITVTAADTIGWTAEAQPNGLPQSNDDKCQWFELSSTGTKRAKNSGGTDTTQECWSK